MKTEMSTGHGVDYFEIFGYKKLAVQLLVTTAEDLICKNTDPQSQEKNSEVYRAAADWVLHPNSDGLAGASFSDCISAIGFTSREDFWRENFIKYPEKTLAGLRDIISTIDGNSRNSNASRESGANFVPLSSAFGKFVPDEQDVLADI